MDVEVLSQVPGGDGPFRRIGDFLIETAAETSVESFFFGVAFVQESGLSRLVPSINELQSRGGEVRGAFGIDHNGTSREALELIEETLDQATIVSTESNITYHPKVYAFEAEDRRIVVIGSPNVTRNGLFRNFELSTVLFLDLEENRDLEIWGEIEAVLDSFLDPSNPNVQPLTQELIGQLSEDGAIPQEGDHRGGSDGGEGGGSSGVSEEMFPRINVPAAPAGDAGGQRYDPDDIPDEEDARVFTMVLSHFDASHQPGTQGTPGALIPKEAVGFFPDISEGPRAHPDTYFDVLLQTPSGDEEVEYRLWYYEEVLSPKSQ